jgi:hypothetical protein
MALMKEDLSGCFIASPKWKVSLSARVAAKAKGWLTLVVPSSNDCVASNCLKLNDMKDIVRSNLFLMSNLVALFRRMALKPKKGLEMRRSAALLSRDERRKPASAKFIEFGICKDASKFTVKL